MRQGANSAVRFTTYSTLKVRPPLPLRRLLLNSSQSFVAGNSRPNETLPAGVTFGIGAFAGVVTVYATMPLEFVLSSPPRVVELSR